MSYGRFGGSSPERARFVQGEGPAGGGIELADDSLRRRIGSLGDLSTGYRDISVRVFNSAAISIANNTNVSLTFDSERWDTEPTSPGMHSTTTNTGRLTVLTPGKYLIFGNVQFDNNVTGNRGIIILLNGTTVIARQRSPATVSSQAHDFMVATHYSLVLNDYVELQVFQNSGGALNVATEANNTPEFGMIRLPV